MEILIKNDVKNEKRNICVILELEIILRYINMELEENEIIRSEEDNYKILLLILEKIYHNGKSMKDLINQRSLIFAWQWDLLLE